MSKKNLPNILIDIGYWLKVHSKKLTQNNDYSK